MPRIISAWLWCLCLLAPLLLAGCSTVRFAYNQAPELSYWWVDNYVDFTDEQTPQVKDSIARWFRWNRSTQLPVYATALAQAQSELPSDTTADQVCTWWQQVARWRDDAFEHAVPAFAEHGLTLSHEQLANVQRRYAKANRDFRRDYLQDSQAERREKAVKRTVERAETVYGKLDPAQRQWVEQKVAASPFDPELWQAERIRRQQDVLQALRGMQQRPPPTKEQAMAAVRAQYQRFLHSPNDRYRAYSQQLTAYNCEFAAQLHNRTTPAQRKTAVEKFRGWEGDLRALMANNGGG